MNIATFELANALTQLYVDWERLIRQRAAARPGTHLRSELDGIYARVLPTIIELTNAVSEDEIDRLIKVAGSLLKQKVDV